MTDPGGAALLQADRGDLETRLETARREQRRHTLWALLGVSPAALPILFAVGDRGAAAVAVATVGIFAVEGWRAFTSGREARRIEIRLLEVSEGIAALEAGEE